MSALSCWYRFFQFLVGLIICILGWTTALHGGKNHWMKYLVFHKDVLPDPLETFVTNFCMFWGLLQVITGLLIACNCRKAGGLLLILNMVFIIIFQDMPDIDGRKKFPQAHTGFKYSTLARHISVIGGGLFLMITEAPVDKSKRTERKNEWIKNYLRVILYVWFI